MRYILALKHPRNFKREINMIENIVVNDQEKRKSTEYNNANFLHIFARIVRC